MSPTRPETTLFLSLSVDGRITSHDSDTFDPDQTWKSQPIIRGILQQFYEFNQPNMVVLTTGFAMKNMGVNNSQAVPRKENLKLVVLDPDADLTPQGLSYLSQNVKKLYLICLTSHPACLRDPGSRKINIIAYPKEIDLNDAFQKLAQSYLVKKLFIHSIAPLNADLIDAGLIDHLSIIISPLLVGGHGTPTLKDSDMLAVRALKLVSVQAFSKDYVNLRYDLL